MAQNDMDTSKMSTGALASYVYWHILQKGWQAGGILAIPLGTAYAAFKIKKISPDIITRAAGLVTGGTLAAVSLLGAAKFTTINREGFEDRSKRLNHNSGQIRTDKFADVGAVLGLATTAFILQSRGMPLQAMNLVGGAAMGSALGVAAHVATKNCQGKVCPKKSWREAKERKAVEVGAVEKEVPM